MLEGGAEGSTKTREVSRVRIPRDISLRAYIQGLIDRDEVEKFYLTEDWQELRLEVLEDYHNECQECLKRGRVTTQALHVHHVNELRHRPDLALSRWYTDSKGRRLPNLVPLCRACHNEAHPEKGYGKSQSGDKFTNEERW